MEKSIEHIWKDGFLKGDALVAPKINNLYKQKSIHIIDKFKRMFRINLIAIIAFSTLFLILSIFLGIPIMGIIFFVTIAILVVINKRLFNSLEKVDTSASSYHYLKAFNLWLEKQIAINIRMSRFLYPIFFISIVFGFWFKDDDGMPLGERALNGFLIDFPNTYLVYGIPLFAIIAFMLIVGILAFFGGRIYKWDLNIVYGGVFKKLEELMADIEELKK